MIRQLARTLKQKLLGQDDMQELLDRGYIKIEKTRQYEAEDHSGNLVWTYRFRFDNHARKRRFMAAATSYQPQNWDQWVTWYDDISNLNGEICAEARVMVPPAESGRFRFQFEQFVTRDMVLKN